MTLTSCIDGRIRLRDVTLRESAVAESLREKLEALPEIRSARVNSRTGSLLLIYDKLRTSLSRMLRTLAGFFGFTEGRREDGTASRETRPYFTGRRTINLGMLASLIVSLGGAIAGTEGLHIAVGVLFVALVGIHLAGRLRPLFT